MGETRIEIPANVSDNFGEPISFILNIISRIYDNSSSGPIIFDFSKCRFANPFIMGGVSCLLNSLSEQGREVKCEFNSENINFSSYINTIQFPNGFNYNSYNLDELNKALEPFHRKNYIPIVYFPTDKTDTVNKIRENVISAVNSIFKNQLNLSGMILEAIYYMVDELTQNVVDHSTCKKGLLFAQFYPTKNFMDICIADYGRGLLRAYRESGKYQPETDAEAINLAIFGKSIKDLPASRGFGLSTSRKMLVEGLKGKFLIYSGKAIFIQNVEKQNVIYLPDQHNYQGCYIALRVPILDNKQFDFYKFIE